MNKKTLFANALHGALHPRASKLQVVNVKEEGGG